eukprot:1361551-Amorphochlora_amoeboformis.AAC.1
MKITGDPGDCWGSLKFLEILEIPKIAGDPEIAGDRLTKYDPSLSARNRVSYYQMTRRDAVSLSFPEDLRLFANCELLG